MMASLPPGRWLAGVAVAAVLLGTVTDAPARDAAPRRAFLLVTSNRDGDTDLYAVSAAGGRLSALTSNYDEDRFATLGTSVVREWRHRVYTLRTDGRWRAIGAGELVGVYDRGQRVVFETSADLVVATIDGRRRWRIVESVRSDVAPDARHVAFARSADDGKPGVLVATVATGKLRRLSSGGGYWTASWSPGSRWVLVEDRDHGRRFVTAVDTTRRVALPAGSGWSEWSPDGRRLAFQTTNDGRDSVGFLDTRSGALWTTEFAGSAGSFTWARNSDRASVNVSGEGGSGIVVLDPSRRTATVVSTESTYTAVLAPDAERVAYVALAPDGDTSALRVVGANGSGPATLVEGTNLGLLGWNPDSRRLLFTRDGRIGVVGVDGRLRGELRTPFDSVDAVRWSPRGDEIALIAGFGGASVYVLDADARGLRRVTRRGDDDVVTWLSSRPAHARAATALPAEQRALSRELQTRGAVVRVSADAGRVAVLVANDDLDCIHPVVWRPGGELVRVGTPAPCASDTLVPLDVGLSGDIVTWSAYSCGNECETGLFSATVAPNDLVSVRSDYSDDPPDPPARTAKTVNGVRMEVDHGVVRMRRESDSRERVVAVAGQRIFDADLDASGLFYAYDLSRGAFRGRVAFIPFADLFA
jgi:Tol biopolymer transport system component